METLYCINLILVGPFHCLLLVCFDSITCTTCIPLTGSQRQLVAYMYCTLRFKNQVSFGEVNQEQTLPPSTRLVSITMPQQSYSQIILHMSLNVQFLGACVAMYSRAEFVPCNASYKYCMAVTWRNFALS